MGRTSQSAKGKNNPSYKHGMTRTPVFESWIHMRQRCKNPKDFAYKDYGGRGISVCGRWHTFENFLEDMGEKPKGLTLERKNNDGNYEPSNCCWATPKEQANNRRIRQDSRWRWFVAINKEIGCEHRHYNQSEFAKEQGLNNGNVHHCLHKKHKFCKGWTFKWL